jgi:20S proteasome alpha/beta subunit
MMNSARYHRVTYRVNRPIHKATKMTYALGVTCENGIILAADTRFTVDCGTDYEYGHKITGEVRGVLTGFAGNREPFEDFRMHLREYAVKLYEEKKEAVRLDELSLRIKDIMRVLDNHYGKFYKFDVLAGVSTNDGAKLRYFYQDGRPEIVDKYKAIGNGAPYGLIYLKTHWRKDIIMDEAADLAYFIIRYIERFKLDLTVGTGEQFPHPLIWFIPNTPYPDGKLDSEPTSDDYKRYESNARLRLNKVESSLVSDYRDIMTP